MSSSDRKIVTPLEFQQERQTTGKIMALEAKIASLQNVVQAQTAVSARLLQNILQALGSNDALTRVLIQKGIVTTAELKAEVAAIQARIDEFTKTGRVPEDALLNEAYTRQSQAASQPQGPDGGHRGDAPDPAGTGDAAGADVRAQEPPAL